MGTRRLDGRLRSGIAGSLLGNLVTASIARWMLCLSFPRSLLDIWLRRLCDSQINLRGLPRLDLPRFVLASLIIAGQLNAPVLLELVAKKLVKVAALVLLVGGPGLAQPLLVVPAELDVLAVAGAVVPKVVIVTERHRVGAGVGGACVQDVSIIRELGENFLLLFLG